MVERSREIVEAEWLARRALEWGKEDAVALCSAGFTLAYVVGDVDDGAAFVSRALILNPNYSRGWAMSGWLRGWLGEPDVAIEHLARAMRLSPRDPYAFGMQAATATAHLIAGRYGEASAWAQEAIRNQPTYLAGPLVAAVANALIGRLEEAKRTVVRL